MAHSSSSLVSLVILALVLYGAPAPTEAITCSEALQYLMPCQPFLLNMGEMSSACCLGAQGLVHAVTSPADRKSVCQCFKQVATTVNINLDKAKQLPLLCKIEVPVAIQPNVDCDAIQMDEMSRSKNMEMHA